MEWGDVLIPAGIGAAVPTLLALIAAARWSGKLDRSVDVIQEKTTSTSNDVIALRASMTSLYETVRDIDVSVRERVTRLEQLAELEAERRRGLIEGERRAERQSVIRLDEPESIDIRSDE